VPTFEPRDGIREISAHILGPSSQLALTRSDDVKHPAMYVSQIRHLQAELTVSAGLQRLSSRAAQRRVDGNRDVQLELLTQRPKQSLGPECARVV
jgi:hypothetical protein